MYGFALSVFEIIGLIAPLVAILIIQIVRNEELRSAIPDNWILELSTGLFITGLLLIGAIFGATAVASRSLTSIFELITLFFLASGIGGLVISATAIPALVMFDSLDFDDEEQTELEDHAESQSGNTQDGTDRDSGQDLGSQENDGEVQTVEPDTEN